MHDLLAGYPSLSRSLSPGRDGRLQHVNNIVGRYWWAHRLL